MLRWNPLKMLPRCALKPIKQLTHHRIHEYDWVMVRLSARRKRFIKRMHTRKQRKPRTARMLGVLHGEVGQS